MTRFLGLLILLLPNLALAQDERAEYIRSHYAKYEYMIPMRDGVRLMTQVYIPYDASSEKTYPLLMIRTPYSVGPYGVDQYRASIGPNSTLEQDGFIFVLQDVRGKYMSEGEFVNMRPHVPADGSKINESTDTYDTIQWLIDNVRHHNDQVGQWGISYPGFYASAGAIDSHPALKAVSPQAPIADWFFDDFHRNGAFVLPMAFNFFSSFGVDRPQPSPQGGARFDHGTRDGYQFFLDLGPLANVQEKYFQGKVKFWSDMAAHPNYDRFWRSRNLLPHLKNIQASVLVVGGWFDTEDLYGPLQTYRAIEGQNPGIENRLVMGPWSHGGWNRGAGDALGDAQFAFATAQWYRENVERPFFLHHLKGVGEMRLAEATVFETGANRWRRFDHWPPAGAQAKDLYLHAQFAIDEAPTTAEDVAADRFVSDPAKPVPYTMEITSGWARDYMTEDQRFAAWRPDVLVYRSPVLEDDLTLAGPIDAELWVSTDQGDADWVVKLIDEYPGAPPNGEKIEGYPSGRQQLVRAGVLRGRFRDSFETPKPFTPGQPTKVVVPLRDILHTFPKGHRLMVQIQSTWFPFIDRNPQSWVKNIFEAQESDFVAATHQVYRDAKHASRLRVRVLQ